MKDISLHTYPEEARSEAAALLQTHAEDLVVAWRRRAEATFRGETTAADALIDGIAQFVDYLAQAVARPSASRRETLLGDLARRLYDDEIPYPLVNRGLRILKRLLTHLLAEQLDGPTVLAPVYHVIEDEIDESRLLLSSHYHGFDQRRVRESEQLTRFLLNNTEEAVFLCDVATSAILMVNAGAMRLTGLSRPELLKRPLEELVPEERRAELRAALERVGVSHTWRLADLPILTAEGEAVAAEVQVTLVRQEVDGAAREASDAPEDAGDRRRKAQVSVRERTDGSVLRRAEDKEAAYLRAFVADTADAVLIVDREGRIRSWNQGAEQIFGYSADEILNQDIRMLLPPEVEASGELERVNEIVQRDGFLRNHQTVRQTRSGRWIDVNITRTAIFDPDTGEWVGTSVVVRDETVERRLARETERQHRQMAVANRLLAATSRSLDRQQTYHAIADEMRTALPFDCLTVEEPEPGGDRLLIHFLAGDEYCTSGESELLVPAHETLRSEVFSAGRALRVFDLRHREALGGFDREHLAGGLHAALCLPLLQHNQVVATLTLLHSQPGIYKEEDVELVHQLAPHLGVALQNARRYEEERKRAGQFELISTVGARAIANIGDVTRLLHEVVETVQSQFGYYDVAMYEYDEERSRFRLRAHSGARRKGLGEGYEQPAGIGVFSEVLRTQVSYLVPDVDLDPHYFNPSPENRTVRSELCVPIRLGPTIFGLLDLESHQTNGFDVLDRAAMEALAGLLARCMQADESLRQTRMLHAMRHQIMEAVPSALLLLDEEYRVKFVNRRYCEFFGQRVEDIMYRHVTEVLPASLIERSRFIALVEELDSSRPIDRREVRYLDHDGQERYVDVRLRLVTEYETTVIVMLHEATNRMQRLYQLSMLREIGEEMQRTLDLDRLLRALLTCVTAGPGFGFNRAALFLFDRDANELVLRMRVGPESAEEAGAIWSKIGHKKSLREFMRDFDADGEAFRTAESDGGAVRLPLGPDDQPVLAWRTAMLLKSDESVRVPVAEALRAFSRAEEVLVVPLVSHEKLLGLIVADNLFTRETISQDSIRMLSTFASQAGLALANAQTFADLERSLAMLRATQDQLRSAEKLAGIGAVAAHVAHEIRNPLVSIGGFARRMQHKREDSEYIDNRAGIIIKEVARLEQILKNVADFTAPGKPVVAPTDVNALVEDVLNLQQPVFEEQRIEAHYERQELPRVIADADKLKQVVLNLVRNAVQAMGTDGSLTVSTAFLDEERRVEVRVSDTGPGVPPDQIEEIFNPFYTKKQDGSGLGLAVSQKIVVDHGGTLTAESRLGEGATFIIRLPLEPPSQTVVEAGSQAEPVEPGPAEKTLSETEPGPPDDPTEPAGDERTEREEQ